MSRDERLGDKMPNSKPVKWGEMRAGESHLSDEWHEMHHSEPRMSEKWVDQHPSKGLMSEKWVEQHPGSTDFSDKWHEMKQEKRMDPYEMHHSAGTLATPFKPMKKETPDNKIERKTQHTEFGSTREL